MEIIDPGHEFRLASLDGQHEQVLTFVKRCDPVECGGGKYPGNHDAHPGTTTQEVIRALIARIEYVQGQIPCQENTLVTLLLRQCLYLLETRAKRCKGQVLNVELVGIEKIPTCPYCGHILCSGCIEN